MRHRITIACFLAIQIAMRVQSAEPPVPPTTASQEQQPEFQVDPKTQKVLDEINSLNAYQAPQLPLKMENRYANTPDEVQPHGHVEPYKRHFLLQMEYTGPGRSIPEPQGRLRP